MLPLLPTLDKTCFASINLISRPSAFGIMGLGFELKRLHNLPSDSSISRAENKPDWPYTEFLEYDLVDPQNKRSCPCSSRLFS